MNKPIVLILLTAFIVAVIFAIAKLKIAGRAPAYQVIPIMTANEIEFFGRLCRALPDYHVFPQVAMAALIRPSNTSKNNRGAFWKISQKHVDFTIFNKDMKLVCIIELDDRMHLAAKDKERDAITESAGIRTLRWQSKTKPSEEVIRSAISAIAAGMLKPT
jgi:hypothetical protein